jgi:hypothetical protein
MASLPKPGYVMLDDAGRNDVYLYSIDVTCQNRIKLSREFSGNMRSILSFYQHG